MAPIVAITRAFLLCALAASAQAWSIPSFEINCDKWHIPQWMRPKVPCKKVEEVAPPNETTVPQGYTNWADEYYPHVPLTYEATWEKISKFPSPDKTPFRYNVPFPSCEKYSAREVFNNPRVFKNDTTTYLPTVYLLTYTSYFAAHMDEPETANWLRCMGIRDIVNVHTKGDNRASVIRSDQAVMILLPGTDGVQQWISNVETWSTNTLYYGHGYPDEKDPRKVNQVKVHKGFHGGVMDLVSKGGLLDATDKMCAAMGSNPTNCPVFVVGHSRGGALAVLMAAHARKIGFNIQGVYPIGGPRVGDKIFARRYEEMGLVNRTMRMIYKSDVVIGTVSNPPFTHVGPQNSIFVTEHCRYEAPNVAANGNSLLNKNDDRDLGDMAEGLRDHYSWLIPRALWERCPNTFFPKGVLPPPPFPDGAFGLARL